MSIGEFIKNATKTEKRQAKKLEVDIEKEFVSYASSKGCLPLKLILLNRRGWPDRTILCPRGRVLFIEFKRTANDKQTAGQMKYQHVIEIYGFEYHVCHDLDDAKSILDEFLK